ncbi:Hypothetical predicted protein [Podarcis lilfordi]|uniref:Uncharacterized protein n=1 Tax=Podarcis lilfordi TaxID=74358 RepID=A0AA35PEM8_9SAUR|nr:Hypothetical predicted protein [Podarcis lilfordi]
MPPTPFFSPLRALNPPHYFSQLFLAHRPSSSFPCCFFSNSTAPFFTLTNSPMLIHATVSLRQIDSRASLSVSVFNYRRLSSVRWLVYTYGCLVVKKRKVLTIV